MYKHTARYSNLDLLNDVTHLVVTVRLLVSNHTLVEEVCAPAFPPEAGILASRLGFEPWGWDSRLEAGIWASRLGFGPRGRDLSLEAWICALRLRCEPVGGGGNGRRNKRIFPLCESIGHRPLWGRCPKVWQYALISNSGQGSMLEPKQI